MDVMPACSPIATSRSLAPALGTSAARKAIVAIRSMRNIEVSSNGGRAVRGNGGCAGARVRAARPGHDTVNGMDPAQRFEALLASGKDSALLRFGLGMHYL